MMMMTAAIMVLMMMTGVVMTAARMRDLAIRSECMQIRSQADDSIWIIR